MPATSVPLWPNYQTLLKCGMWDEGRHGKPIPISLGAEVQLIEDKYEI